ncbi:hypothetical protein, partial [Streptomyces neyagawaensis]
MHLHLRLRRILTVPGQPPVKGRPPLFTTPDRHPPRRLTKTERVLPLGRLERLGFLALNHRLKHGGPVVRRRRTQPIKGPPVGTQQGRTGTIDRVEDAGKPIRIGEGQEPGVEDQFLQPPGGGREVGQMLPQQRGGQTPVAAPARVPGNQAEQSIDKPGSRPRIPLPKKPGRSLGGQVIPNGTSQRGKYVLVHGAPHLPTPQGRLTP